MEAMMEEIENVPDEMLDNDVASTNMLHINESAMGIKSKEKLSSATKHFDTFLKLYGSKILGVHSSIKLTYDVLTYDHMTNDLFGKFANYMCNVAVNTKLKKDKDEEKQCMTLEPGLLYEIEIKIKKDMICI